MSGLCAEHEWRRQKSRSYASPRLAVARVQVITDMRQGGHSVRRFGFHGPVLRVKMRS